MNVTFFEDQPFYPKTNVQGENRLEEHQFWSYLDVPAPVLSVPSSSMPSPVLSSPSCVPSPMPSPVPMSIQEKPKEILAYSRRQKVQKEAEDRVLSQQCQEANLSSSPPENHTSNDPHNSVCLEVVNNLDQPITLRKEKQSYTIHLISKYMSYKGLSSRYKAFSTALTDIQIPKSIQKALSQPEWKKAVMEEMGALERNKT